ncbi:MAG: GIY-YIG nuclease family protein [Kiritimatiellales bacterium]
MDAGKLRALIEDDDLGLLDIKPESSNRLSEDERLTESFYEITEFRRQHGRAPKNDISNVQEYRLAARLQSLKNDSEKIKALIDLDEFGLLTSEKLPENITEIFDDDDLNLLNENPADSIFSLRHIPQDIAMPDYIAQRKPCRDFSRFEPLFKQCQAELKTGRRTLLPFSIERQIQKGHFFVLSGILTFVADVGEKEKTGGKVNARLRCIFENGTESDLLLRSLARALYKNGRRVTEHQDRLMDDLNNITEEDGQTGFIYILRSLSADPQITSIEHLYKIGFSTVPVDERVKNAKDDPTFLMAPVHIVETFECYNLNPQKLELLLHRFFGKVCLNADVFDAVGIRYTPREWFSVPLPVIEEAIELIISGKIIDFTYDEETKLIRRK